MIRLLLASTICFLSLAAHADLDGRGRSTGLFFGGGFQKSLTTIESDSGEAKFDGWGYSAEVGVDFAWSRNFGNTLSAEYKLGEIINKKKDADSIEKAEQKATSYRAGFFYQHFGFGYGMSSEKTEIKQVSTASGSSTSNISGDVTEIYVNYNLEIPRNYRLTFEIQKRDGDLDDYKLNEIKALMKFFIISAF